MNEVDGLQKMQEEMLAIINKCWYPFVFVLVFIIIGVLITGHAEDIQFAVEDFLEKLFSKFPKKEKEEGEEKEAILRDSLWFLPIHTACKDVLHSLESEPKSCELDNKLKQLQISMKEAVCYDANYILNHSTVKEKEICSLSCHEIYTRLTYIFEIEKYEEGTIRKSIDDGTMERLLKRYVSLSPYKPVV